MPSETCNPPDPTMMGYMGLFLLDWLVGVTVSSVFYGLFVMLLYQLVAAFIRKGSLGRDKHWMLVACAVSFLLATFRLVASITYMGIYVHSVFFEYQDISMMFQLSSRGLRICSFMADCADTFELVLSDSIVVWRSLVLLRHKRQLIILPLLLLLDTVLAALLRLIKLESQSEAKYFLVILGLSLVTNIVATTLIGYVYWAHRKDMASGLHMRQRRSQVERILAIVVESGVVFCLLQTVFLVLSGLPVSLGNIYVVEVFTSGFWGFAAIYPTLVVVLVNRCSTIDEAYPSLPPISPGLDTDHAETLERISFSTPSLATSTNTLSGQTRKKTASHEA